MDMHINNPTKIFTMSFYTFLKKTIIFFLFSLIHLWKNHPLYLNKSIIKNIFRLTSLRNKPNPQYSSN